VARIAKPLATWLSQHHPATALVQSHAIEQARRTLKDLQAPSRVVVVGGDGTVHHLLDSLTAAGHSLGLLPLGSGNDTARGLGVHAMPWQEALHLALTGTASPIDLGEVTLGLPDGAIRMRFISSLAAGFDAAIALRAHAGPKWLIGMPRYLRATVLELAHLASQRIEVVVDGRPVHNSPALFASSLNTRSYGSGMPAVPMARIDDGLLNLLLAGQFGRLQALWMLPRLLAGTHMPHPRIVTHTFAELRLTAAQPLPLAADGEPVPAASQVMVRVLPKSLLVVRAAA
jgi:diacylglycerol kinase family enzyme